MTQEKQEAEQVVVTPSAPEVDIASLQEKLTRLETELEQKDKGFKSLQQSLTQKDRELKSQADLRAEITRIGQRLDEQREVSELQAAAIALGREGNEEEIAKVNSLLRTKIAEQDANRKQVELKGRQEADALARQEYNQKANAVYAQAQTLFEGDDLKDIEDLLSSGNLIIAQREVRNASKGKTPTPKVESPKETEEDKVARLVKEKLAKDYPQMYASDTGLPSGGKPTSTTDAMAKYGRGEISAEEAQKYGVKFI